jgi:hypothetical protein
MEALRIKMVTRWISGTRRRFFAGVALDPDTASVWAAPADLSVDQHLHFAGQLSNVGAQEGADLAF